jgi:branched-chain amino acid transport system permease protein
MIQAGITGLSAGGAYAALGVCVVLLYRMVAVVNFSLAAAAADGWFVLLVLHQHGMAYGPAALIGVATGAAVSAIVGTIMALWFAEADVRTKSTIGIAAFIAINTISFRVFGDNARPIPTQLTGRAFELGGVYVTGSTVAAIVGSVVLAIAVSAVLAKTRIGSELRALSERPRTAELMGMSVRLRTISVWAVVGAIATIAMLAIGPQQSSSFSAMSLLVVPAFAAALVGLFRNFYATVIGGIAIGVIQGMASESSTFAQYQDVVPFVIIVVAILWAQRGEVWDVAR